MDATPGSFPGSLAGSAARLPDEAGNDVADRHALRTGGECQRHAMLQDGLGKRMDIVERGGETALVEGAGAGRQRSEEHTSELQSLMRNSYAVLCLKQKK